jgi:hypothetical protein
MLIKSSNLDRPTCYLLSRDELLCAELRLETFYSEPFHSAPSTLSFFSSSNELVNQLTLTVQCPGVHTFKVSDFLALSSVALDDYYLIQLYTKHKALLFLLQDNTPSFHILPLHIVRFPRSQWYEIDMYASSSPSLKLSSLQESSVSLMITTFGEEKNLQQVVTCRGHHLIPFKISKSLSQRRRQRMVRVKISPIEVSAACGVLLSNQFLGARYGEF